ncbi:hypothetical protein DU508_23200 [Pedobacter chinensis]|uniref:Uncharacterized protein n=2 Tax=Pedobacter chinensis TaxID=2282421 RepID=A0A369PNH2_9SPHI|nr:hypothetical protein DU508_23200 [Pedobacter chinensis]
MFVSVMAFLFSCGQNNKGKVGVLTDSLIRATEDIAVGNAKFGISEKEFNELYPDSLIDLDGNKYILTSFFNSSNELNMVYLIDSATFYNTKFDQALFNRMDLIKEYFMKTYGTPQHNSGYPKEKKMKNGKAFEACIWNVGKKKIAVGVALEETDRGNIYYVISHVDRNNL